MFHGLREFRIIKSPGGNSVGLRQSRPGAGRSGCVSAWDIRPWTALGGFTGLNTSAPSRFIGLTKERQRPPRKNKTVNREAPHGPAAAGRARQSTRTVQTSTSVAFAADSSAVSSRPFQPTHQLLYCSRKMCVAHSAVRCRQSTPRPTSLAVVSECLHGRVSRVQLDVAIDRAHNRVAIAFDLKGRPLPAFGKSSSSRVEGEEVATPLVSLSAWSRWARLPSPQLDSWIRAGCKLRLPCEVFVAP